MRLLLKSLLDYSLLGKDSDKTDVDCNKLVGEVLDDLTDSIIESDAIITTEDLPAIKGYATELRLLFRHLIINAIKFRKKDIPPEIKISVELLDQKWKFAVQDNGMGIKERDRENVFMIFKRMVKRDDYEGIGIGLAQCKKIVELHGGEIWVESIENSCSTFMFTIPVSS